VRIHLISNEPDSVPRTVDACEWLRVRNVFLQRSRGLGDSLVHVLYVYLVEIHRLCIGTFWRLTRIKFTPVSPMLVALMESLSHSFLRIPRM